MKIYIPIVFICCFVLLQSNSLKLVNATDYRDPYCGSYSGKRIYQSPDPSLAKLNFDTTACTITVSKNVMDSVLNITTADETYTVKLIGNSFRSVQKRVFGSFSGDTIRLKYIPSLAPFSYMYSGVK